MIAATALTSLKRRLDIDSSDTSFDAQLNEFVLSAVGRLYPVAQKEVPTQTKNVTVDNFGETTVDLSALTTPCMAARKVEYREQSGVWAPADATYHHGVSLQVRELPTYVTTLNIYGVTMFDLATVPAYLEQAILWYAMAEFYDFLAGNKRKYNLYQLNGARAVDNMEDQSEFFEGKANVYLADRATIYGVA